MSIYAISDLHLSFGENKPMDIFGANWENHAEKIKENWIKKVTDNIISDKRFLTENDKNFFQNDDILMAAMFSYARS